MKSENIFKKLNKKFLLSYLKLLILPIFVGLFIFISAISALTQKQLQYIKSDYLKYWQSNIDMQIFDINRIAENIYKLDEIQILSQAQDEFIDLHYYLYAKAKPILINYCMSNDLIVDFFINMYNSDVIVASRSTFQIPFFYNNIFKYNNISVSKCEDMWQPSKSITSLKEHSITYEKNDYNALTYVVPDFNIFDIQRQNIFFILDMDVLRENYLYNIKKQNIYSLFIQSNDGEIISVLHGDMLSANSINHKYKTQSNNDNITYDRKNDIYILSSKSEVSDYNYVLSIKRADVLSYLKTEITLLSLVIGLGFLVSVLLVFYFAINKWRKLNNILLLFDNNNTITKSDNLYKFIKDETQIILQNNMDLKTMLKIQSPILNKSIISVLLLGSLNKTDNNDKIINTFYDDIDNTVFIVCIIKEQQRIGRETNEFAVEHNIKSCLEKHSSMSIKESVLVSLYNNNVLIIPISSTNETDALAYAKQACINLNEAMQQDNIIGLHFCLGNPCNDIYKISKSYEQALLCAENDMYDNFSVVLYNSKDFSGSGYYYPINTEVRLINTIKQLNSIQAMQIIDDIYEENIINRQISFISLEQLVDELIGSIRRVICSNIDMKDFIDLNQLKNAFNIKHHSNPKKIFDKIKDTIKQIIKELSIRQKNNITGLSKNILAFINENYTIPEMSLQLISDKYNVSTNFISHLFKISYNENFISFLTRLRIEKACKLIQKKKYTIVTIAAKVGYNNDVSFRRAFKRITGVSPKYYKKS